MEEPSDKIHATAPRYVMMISRTNVIAKYETGNVNMQEAVFSQPDTHPITKEQLVNEVQVIYTGLVWLRENGGD